MKEHYKKIGDITYLSAEYLVNCGMNRRSLENYISFYNNGKSNAFESIKDSPGKTKWIAYKSIPKKVLEKLSIPTTEEETVTLMAKMAQRDLQKKHREIWLILSNAWSNPMYWKQYVPYYTKFYLNRPNDLIAA